jgi:hypothetical protein
VHAVSETGFILRRDADGAVSSSRSPKWRLSRGDLQDLGGHVECERQRVGALVTSTSPTLIVDVDADTWDERIDLFVARQREHRVAAASADEFVRRTLPPADTNAAPVQRTEIALADGRLYQPRTIDGMLDVEVLKRTARAHMSLLLSGPAGTGKSSAIFAACGADLEIVHCYEGMTREDVFGMLSPVAGCPGDYRYVDGPVPRAMLAGVPVLIDDANWMPPGVQALLLPAADDHRRIEIIDRTAGQVVTAQAGFSLLFTQNPGVGFGLIGPLWDRLSLVVHVPVDYDIAADKGVPLPLVEVAKERQDAVQESGDYTLWLPSIRELLHAKRSEDLFGLPFAARTLISKCPADQRAEFVEAMQRYVPTAAGELTSQY